ncbi:MAG TPA: CRTAC1 family protein [Candidatus Latescibacteria bacterium]|nr:CRTAC1 family protein [Candidatus Latescibacterota bacterium]
MIHLPRLVYGCVGVFLLATALTAQAGSVGFVDQSEAAGIAVTNVSGTPTQDYIVDVNMGGSAFFDYDGDGDVDLYLPNGSRLVAPPVPHPENKLFRNRGDGGFDDVTVAAGVGDTAWAMGCAVADVDNDGHQDLYVTNFGPNRLYMNRGDSTFVEGGAVSGTDHAGFSTGASFGDIDLDGDLDLHVANYQVFDLDFKSPIPCVWRGLDVFCGPKGQRPQANVFYLNDGDGTFSDATEAAGLSGPRHFSFESMFTDFDDDGWIDLLVVNDQGPNYLYRNRGDGTFEDQALMAGVAYSGEGSMQGCMGVARGDYDGDGRQDYFVTNFTDEHNTLYRNDGDGFFLDLSFPSMASVLGEPYVGWGTVFFDRDNDGDQDLYVANGHVYPQTDLPRIGIGYAEPNFLLDNSGTGRFTDVTGTSGPGLDVVKVSRGVTVADYDDDGDLDLFVFNLNDTPSLLRNDGGNRLNWLKVKVVGTRSNRDGIGARVTVESGGRTQSMEVQGSGGYLSHSDIRRHFGLGSATTVDRVEVRWPGGTVQTQYDVAVNQTLTIRESAD